MIGITERGDACVHYHELNFDGLLGVVLITKDPAGLLQKFSHFGEPPVPYIVHCTITGHGATKMEPNVPPVEASIEAWKTFCSTIGLERTVLRVDPIFPTDNGFQAAKPILKQAGPEHRLRISFADAFPHVRQRLLAAFGKEPAWKGVHAKIGPRRHIVDNILTMKLKPEICGEPGFVCTGCVSARDLRALGVSCREALPLRPQRHPCMCLAVKKELLAHKSPCFHGCLYCYWQS